MRLDAVFVRFVGAVGVLGACDLQDPPTVVCTPAVDVPAIVLDSCEDGQILLSFVSTREAGRPESVELPFDVPDDGEVCIEIVSPAEAGGVPAAAADVTLDGIAIRAPSDFRHAPTSARDRRPLMAGEHVVAIRHRSTPGSTIAVRVRFAGSAEGERLATEVRAIEEAEFAACNELNRTLEGLPPERRERFVDAMVTLGLQPGQMVAEHNAWGSLSHLAPLSTERLVPPGATPSEAASDWVARHRTLLGVEDPDIAIEVRSSSAVADGHRVQFGVSWRGLGVAGAGLTLFLDTDLETRAFTGEVPPRVAALGTPLATEAEAIVAAEIAAGAAAAGPASLQILDLGAIASEPRTALVWLVPTEAGLVRVDAGDRTVLDISSGVFEYERVLVEHQATITSPRRAIVREDTRGTFLPASDVCLSADCLAIHDALDRVDFYFRFGMNRTGWSGDGNDVLRPDEHYTMVYNLPPDLGIVPGFTGFAQQPSDPSASGFTHNVDLRRPDRTSVGGAVDLRPAVGITSLYLTENVVVHEWGHMMFEEVLNRGELTHVRPCELSRIHEHVGDMVAMLTAGFFGRSIDAQLVSERNLIGGTDPLSARIRDHRTLGAPVYDPEVSPSASTCAESSHLSGTTITPTIASTTERGVCFPHRNSCVYTRLWALGREADDAGRRIRYHGVDVVGIPFTEGKHLFNTMLLGHLSEGDNAATYGTRYAEAAARRVAACVADDSCPELFAGTSFEDGLAAPMFAVGLWTPEFDLSRLGSVVGPAVAVRDGSVWVFFAPDDDGAVSILEDADILDGAPGVARPLSERGVPLPATRSDLAAARSLDLVTLAVIPFGGGRVVLASTVSEFDSTWRSDLVEVPVPGVREGLGALAVTHRAVPGFPPRTTPVVVAGRVLSGAQHLVAFTGRAATPVVIADSPGEGSPALTAGETFDTVVLWSVGGDGLIRRVGTLSSSGAVTWTAREIVAAIDSIPGNGLVAGSFLGRMQFLLPSEVRAASGFFETRLAHHSEPGGNVWRSNFTWERRPAMFEVTAPDGLPRQVVLGFSRVSGGRRLAIATRRSD